MPVRKLKPIEERDPYAALVLEAFDAQQNTMNPVERELKTMRGFAACLHDEDCLDEADKELARLLAVDAAARRVVASFEALGTAQHAGSLLMERGNCEAAMVALKASLFNAKVTGLAPGKDDK
jgi:hypothetical protein